MSPPSTAPDIACDVLVLGSGAGGLAAAVTAAHLGLHTVLVEKAEHIGGTTAWSGGWMWVPRNPLAAGIDEAPEAPLAYLREVMAAQAVGGDTDAGDGQAQAVQVDDARLQAYLQHAPRMVEFFARHTALAFVDGNRIPDFHGHLPHAALGGRSVCAAPFDARRLGKQVHWLRPPLLEGTLWGLQIAAGAELRQFLDARGSLRAARHVLRRLLRHGWDLLWHRRSLHLANGNALAGALLCSAHEKGVDLRVRHTARALLVQGGTSSPSADTSSPAIRVGGALVDTPQGPLVIRARRAVVLACGGFPHDAARLRQWLGPAAAPGEPAGAPNPAGAEHAVVHHSAAAWSNTGDGLRLAESIGAALSVPGLHVRDVLAWAPVSLVPRPGGGVTHWPHLFERGKPGLIAVRADGQRFTNEADSYHDFMRGLLGASARAGATPGNGVPTSASTSAWLIADSRFVAAYGLGAAKPEPFSPKPWLDCGYLRCGDTLADLATACGIDAQALQQTVQRYNAMAAAGVDEDFRKGETPYNRMQGDSAAVHDTQPNPCMAPLLAPPFYAVQIVAGSLGTFGGVRVDAHARVLDTQGRVIEGLYAVGNDQASVMAGHYPSGGITLGPAMTFGYLAACHVAAQRPGPPDQQPAAAL